MNDELFNLERRIARRADELSHQFGYNPHRALEHWRQAETEIWEGLSLDWKLAESPAESAGAMRDLRPCNRTRR